MLHPGRHGNDLAFHELADCLRNKALLFIQFNHTDSSYGGQRLASTSESAAGVIPRHSTSTNCSAAGENDREALPMIPIFRMSAGERIGRMPL
jgi:hypothetical protein